MADCKRKTANLFSDKLVGMTWWNGLITADERFTLYIAEVKPNTTYTASGNNSVDNIMVAYFSVYPEEGQASVDPERYVYPTNPARSIATFTIPDDSRIKYAVVRFGSTATDVMFNLGSIALPYEPHGWVHSLRKLSTDTDIVTTLPVVLYPTDTTATIGLKGQTIQNGTPTPNSPIIPEGCGDWDSNPAGINKLSQREYAIADGLSNESSTKPSAIEIIYAGKTSAPAIPSDVSSESAYQQWYRARTTYIGDDRYEYTADDRPCDYEHCQFFGSLKAGNYKLVCEAYVDTDHYPWVLRTHDNQNPYIALLTEDNQILVKKSMNQAYAPTVNDPLFDGYYTTSTKFYHEEYPFTISEDTSVGFISKIYAQYNGNVYTRFQIVDADVVAKPFTNTTYNISGVTCWEPYKDPPGYKIPISSANTTTPVYLGEVETTRKIKKLVLDGTEKWQLYSRIASVGGKFFNLPIATQERTEFGKTLCSHYTIGNPYDRLTACCVAVNYSQGIDIRVNNPSTDGNITDFKTYLQQQYANGTPVTIWYVLTTEETGIVNEPLMKIGNYADEVSNISIPVSAGGDTLSVDTTVQPSEMTANYEGWHPVQSTHEKSRNLFDKSTWNGVSAQRGTIEAVTNGFKLTATGDDCYSQTYASFAPSCSYAVTSGETYTLSWDIDNPNIYGIVFVFTGVSFASSTLTSVTASSKKVTFTIPSGHKYVAFRIGVAHSGDSLIYTNIMLNEGSTALPYEPYWK